MSTFIHLASDTVSLNEGMSLVVPPVGNYYGSVAEADHYFNSKLFVTAWTNSSDYDKVRALIMASKAIDRLNFSGVKEDSSQVLQFPRKPDDYLTNTDYTADTDVPNDIKIAAYEIAFAFIDGVDISKEMENQSATSQGFSGARTTYDRTQVSYHLRAGIPSIVAWNYLLPYLRDNHRINLI